MNPSVVLLGLVVFCLTIFGTADGKNIDEEIHAEAKNHHQRSHHGVHSSHENNHRTNQEKHNSGYHHYARHHKGLKARANSTNSSACVTICELELAAIAAWFNNTRELKLLFLLIPPSVQKIIFGNFSFPNVSDGNCNKTFNGTNGSIIVNLNLLYDAAVEWPILTYFAKLIGYFLSRVRGLVELFSIFPEFAKIWKIILHAFAGGSGSTDILIDNLKNLFGFNGTWNGTNLFNFTYWEHIWSPSKFIQGFEHALEGGLEAFANFTKLIP